MSRYDAYILVLSQETVDKLVGLLSTVLQDPQIKKTLVELVTQLCKEPEVLQALSELTLDLVARQDVINVRHLPFYFRLCLFISYS